MGAPICTLKPTVPVPTNTDVFEPSIPVATPENLVQVVNAIRQTLVGAQGGGSGSGGGGNQGGNQGGGFTSNTQNQFKVINQVVKPVKVYDPNDPSGNTFVTVNQIVSLTMQNPYDKSTWVWNQPPSN
jgi:hypothetical protein